jgi:hypothetical protein
MIDAAMSLCVMAIFAVWGALSVLNQFSPTYFRSHGWRSRPSQLLLWVKRGDIFSLLPIWTFFAPTPGTRDHDVLYRDELVDGTLTPWHSVCDNSMTLTCVLWNPRKRLKKAIVDMSDSLLHSLYLVTKAKGDPSSIPITLPYLGLATRVSGFERGPLSVRTQFVIAFSEGYRTEGEPVILYISPLFKIR